MSFWSSQTIIERGTREKIVEPFEESKVKESAYSLSVGEEIFITSASNDEFDKVQKIKTEDNICFIPPGQFAYILTNETINIPNNCLAFISMKFKIKADGLINVSGFHVDPGYKGKLIFAVYNAGVQDIPLRKGKEIFLIWFSSLDATDSKPREKLGIQEIDSEIINNAKNAETLKNISDKLKDLEKQQNISSIRSTLLLSLLVPFNLWLVRFIPDKYQKEITDFLNNGDKVYQAFMTLVYFVIIIIIIEIIIFFAKKSFISKFLKLTTNKLKNLYSRITNR